MGSPLILGVAVLETSGLGLGFEEGVATRPVVTPRYDLCIVSSDSLAESCLDFLRIGGMVVGRK